MLGSRSARPHRTAALAGGLVVGALAFAACSSSEVTTSSTAAPVTDPPATTVATTTIAPTTTTTTVASTTTSSTTSTTTTSTSTTTTTLPPTTTEPLAVQELVLRGDGIGSAAFGADPDGVIAYVTSILGGNTGDTGWVDPFTFADCGPATVARKVDWGVLSLLFSDLSIYADGRQHFIGYEYGRVGQIGDEPLGLRTPGGVTLGSRVVDLLAEFPDASINEGDPEVGIPDNFYVSDVFYGLVTGVDPDDLVTVIFGGAGCAE